MNKQQIKTGLASLLVGVVAPVALLVPSVNAASIIWTGATDDFYSEASNWSGGVLPGANDSAVFNTSSNQQSVSVPSGAGSINIGSIIFSGAVAQSSKSYTLTGGTFTIGSAIEAIMTGTGGDHQVKNSIVLGSDATFKTTGVNTLTVGDTGKTLNLGTNDLTIQADGGTITLAGAVDGSGKLIKRGSGKLNMLATPTDSFTGSTEVSEGELVVTETTQGNFFINGGTLKGSSDLLGDVTMSSGAVAPGLSPGCLGTGNLTLTGGTYTVEIGGKTICTEHDNITVEGMVNLGTETTLDIQWINGFEPAVNDAFPIILNDGDDAVIGNFKGLVDGAKITVDGYTYQVNYNAGDGNNNVFVLVTGTPSAPDTGVGSILSNQFAVLAALVAAVAVVGGFKYADIRRK